jgi:hypothetical protein
VETHYPPVSSGRANLSIAIEKLISMMIMAIYALRFCEAEAIRSFDHGTIS